MILKKHIADHSLFYLLLCAAAEENYFSEDGNRTFRVASAFFHRYVVDTEHPAAGKSHIGRCIDVNNGRLTRTRYGVEPETVASVESDL